MTEPNDEKPQIDLSDVGSIQSLDTARMALRWALERLRVLDRSRTDAEKSARRLEEETRVRSAELAQSALDRAKLETWLLDLLSEKLDTSALRESLTPRLRQLQDESARRRGDLESRAKSEGAEAGSASEILRRSADALAAQDRRMDCWNGLIQEHAQLSATRGLLAEKMKGLQRSLAQEAERLPPPAVAPLNLGEPSRTGAAEVSDAVRARWMQEREALAEKLRAAEGELAALRGEIARSAERSLPADMPPELTRALAGKFKTMLESWDTWEESRRKILEEEREAQRAAFLGDLRQAEATGEDTRALLAQSRRRQLEQAAKSQAAAAEEFRRMLQGWEMEHSARRRALEQGLEKDRLQLSQEVAAHARALEQTGTPQAEAAIGELRLRLESQERHYQEILAQEREQSQALLRVRAEEEDSRRRAWEVAAELERRRLKEEVDLAKARAEDLLRRDVENRTALARLREEAGQSLQTRDLEERARLRAAETEWAQERRKIREEAVERVARLAELEKRVDEQRATIARLQERLGQEMRSREEELQVRDTERERAAQAMARMRTELEKVAQDYQDYRKLQESAPPAAPGLPWAEAEGLRLRAEEAEKNLRERYIQDLTKSGSSAHADSEESRRLRAELARTQSELAAQLGAQERIRAEAAEELYRIRAEVERAAAEPVPADPALAARLAELEGLAAAREGQVAELQARLAAAPTPDPAAAARAAELEALGAAREKEVAELRERLAAIPPADPSLPGRLAELEAAMAARETDIVQLRAQLGAQETEAAGLRLRAEAASSQEPAWAARSAELEARNAAHEQELAELRARLSAAPAQDPAPSAKEAELEARLAALSASRESEIAELQAKIAAAPAADPALPAKVAELEAQLASLRQELDEARAKAASAPAPAPTAEAAGRLAELEAAQAEQGREVRDLKELLERERTEASARSAQADAEFEALRVKLGALAEAYMKELSMWEQSGGAV